MKISLKSLIFLFSIIYQIVCVSPAFCREIKQQADKKIVLQFKKANDYFKKGKFNYDKGLMDKAIKSLHKCVDEYTQHCSAHFYLSKIHFQKEQFPQALHHIQEAKKTI